MKNLIKYIFPTIIFLLGFSCDKNETVKTDDKCGNLTAKFIRNWCVDDWAVIEILSKKSIGEDWTWYKTYHNAILAKLDSSSSISQANKDWSKVIGSSDSVFYFNYVLEQLENGCKLCCPPTENILITSFALHPCASGN